MADGMTNPSAGWYADPSSPDQVRYWDGNAWTDQVQAAGSAVSSPTTMSAVDAVRTVFAKYAVFTGRAGRAEFWWWYAFTVMIDAVMQALQRLAGGGVAGLGISIFSAGLTLALFIPTLAVTWRRLHDTNRSGWWAVGFMVAEVALGFFVLFAAIISAGLLLVAVPAMLAVVLWWIVLLVQRGTPGPNRYGNPV